jgi:hypothetical protein
MFKNFDWKAALETLAFIASVCCFFFGIVLSIVYESWLWFLLWIPGSLIHALCAGMGG